MSTTALIVIGLVVVAGIVFFVLSQQRSTAPIFGSGAPAVGSGASGLGALIASVGTSAAGIAGSVATYAASDGRNTEQTAAMGDGA